MLTAVYMYHSDGSFLIITACTKLCLKKCLQMLICNFFLNLFTIQVLARIANATRPAITLSEIASSEQLTKLLLLCVSSEHNQGTSSWGGPWASHAITCLLQDILEGMSHPQIYAILLNRQNIAKCSYIRIIFNHYNLMFSKMS